MKLTTVDLLAIQYNIGIPHKRPEDVMTYGIYSIVLLQYCGYWGPSMTMTVDDIDDIDWRNWPVVAIILEGTIHYLMIQYSVLLIYLELKEVLCADLMTEEDILVVFIDVNGRTSNAVTYWLLLLVFY